MELLPQRPINVVYRIGELELDPATRELLGRRGPVALQPRVFDLLVYLIRRRHRVVTHEEIRQTLWGGTVVTEDSLSYAVAEARRALGDDGAAQRAIRTVRSRGYRFVAAVEELPGAPPTSRGTLHPAPAICPTCGQSLKG